MNKEGGFGISKIIDEWIKCFHLKHHSKLNTSLNYPRLFFNQKNNTFGFTETFTIQ